MRALDAATRHGIAGAGILPGQHRDEPLVGLSGTQRHASAGEIEIRPVHCVRSAKGDLEQRLLPFGIEQRNHQRTLRGLAVVDGVSFTDPIGTKGGGSYRYQVCQVGRVVCSDLVDVVF